MKKSLLAIVLAFFVVFGANAQKGVLRVDGKTTQKKETKEFIKKTENVVQRVKAPAYVPSNSKGVLLEEGFEGGALPTGWSQVQENGTVDWTYENGGHSGNPASAHTGSFNALFYAGSYSGYSTYLVTPSIDMSLGNSKLIFWHVQDAWGSDQDTLAVYFKEGAAGTWTYLQGWTGEITDWQEEDIVIPSSSNDVYIGFFGYQGYGWGVGIDDVKVTSPNSIDASVTAVTSPSAGFVGGNSDFKVNLANLGLTDMTACDITWEVYDVTNSAVISSGTTNWTGSLTVNTSEEVTLTTFTAAWSTEYRFTATADLTGDEDNTNDGIVTNFSTAMLVTAPYTQDFENAGAIPDGWTMSGFEDWKFTNDIGHGADSPHGGVYYTGLDNSGADTGQESNLITPFVDLSALTVATVYFYYQNVDDGAPVTSNIAELHVDVYNGTTWTNDILVITDEVNAWAEYYASLSGYGNIVQIRFRGITTAGYLSDPSVDDVVIGNGPDHEFGITNLDMPKKLKPGESTTPHVTIHNFGVNDEATWSVVLTDGGTYNETITDLSTITSGSDLILDFPVWTPAEGAYTMTATVTLTDDYDTSNNTLSAIVPVIDYKFAYAYDKSVGKVGNLFLGTADITYTGGNTQINGAAWRNGELYGQDAFGNFGIIDPATGTFSITGPTGITSDFHITLAYDPQGDKFYSLGLTGSYPNFDVGLWEIDGSTGVATGTTNNTGHTGTPLAIACSTDGHLYAVEHVQGGNGTLYEIDKTTGAFTLIGTDLGAVVSLNFQAMSWDNNENKCYFQAYGSGTDMNGTYVIDVAAGTATLMGAPLNEQIIALAIPTFKATFTVDDGTNPIDGATVTIDGNDYVTAGGGIAEVDLAYGEYPYSATATGFRPFNSTTDLVVDGAVAQGITLVAQETGKDFLTYGFSSPVATGTINTGDHTVSIEVPYGTDITGLVADFTNSTLSTVAVGATPQVSGTTPNDFTNPVVYTITAEDMSTQDWTVTITIADAINDIALQGISVYPNPSNGTFTVNVENNFNLEVLDITGKVISTQVLNGTNTVIINNAGVYFLKFSNNEGSVTQKIIVQ